MNKIWTFMTFVPLIKDLIFQKGLSPLLVEIEL